MGDTKTPILSSKGQVPGPHDEETMVCRYAFTSGYYRGTILTGFGSESEIFFYTTPVLLAQFVLIFLISRAIYFFLKPLRQSTMNAQIIAGIIMGPSFLGRNQRYVEKMLSPTGKMILRTFGDMGFTFHLFLLGVQIDPTMYSKAGRNAALIGTAGFGISFFLGALTIVKLPVLLKLEGNMVKGLPLIAMVNSISAFPVITSMLADLNILNSELGKLATFSTIVSELWSFSLAAVAGIIGTAIRTKHWEYLWSFFWTVFYVTAAAFVLRPWIQRIGGKTTAQGGGSMKESHFVAIMVLVLVGGFVSEFLGENGGLCSFVLGLAMPDGPPIGEELVYKLEAMSTGILLPMKFGITGMNTDLFSIETRTAFAVEFTLFVGYVGKFFGILAAATYCSVSLRDSIVLAMIMCCKGVVEIAIYCLWTDRGFIGTKEYTLLTVTMLIITGVFRFLVGHLYDPSRRYMIHSSTNLQSHRHHNSQLSMLVCIHNEDNVPAMINLLDASNPTKQSPISVVVLRLTELKGSAVPTLVPNFRRGSLTSNSLNHSAHSIVNAFDYYAFNESNLNLQHFTASAPYASMHDDICTLALDKSVTIVIVPFHKQWAIDGTMGATFPAIRTVNLNVIKKAPCSVGVLIDRNQMRGNNWSVLTSHSLFRIALLFVGGSDDREALAYARRMSERARVVLTVVWIRPRRLQSRNSSEGRVVDDVRLMNEFRGIAKGKQEIVFHEEFVDDAVGIARIINSMGDSIDLFIVGRHHGTDSSLFTSSLTEWIECPELGFIGDTLASVDFQFSVLVVREKPVGSSDSFLEKSYSIYADAAAAASSSINSDHAQSMRSAQNRV